MSNFGIRVNDTYQQKYVSKMEVSSPIEAFYDTYLPLKIPTYIFGEI